jgi:hypothetical protein
MKPGCNTDFDLYCMPRSSVSFPHRMLVHGLALVYRILGTAILPLFCCLTSCAHHIKTSFRAPITLRTCTHNINTTHMHILT